MRRKALCRTALITLGLGNILDKKHANKYKALMLNLHLIPSSSVRHLEAGQSNSQKRDLPEEELETANESPEIVMSLYVLAGV